MEPASGGSCLTCYGEGRIGNCPDCRGRGVFLGRPLAETGCVTCQTKGWIGNCPSCLGVGILVVGAGYKACVACDGYGHLEADLRPQVRAPFALIAKISSQPRFRVACGPCRVGLGRWGRPHADVDLRLHDPMVAKDHFEVVWDERIEAHIVRNRGARYLPSLNGKPVDDEGLRLSVGDVISIGAWTVDYVALVAD